jgi:hypothetical protein
MSRTTHTLIYATIAAFGAIAIALLVYLAGMDQNWMNLSYLTYITVTVLALKSWRDKEKGGFISFGGGMGYATIYAVFYSVMMAIWAYVFFAYIAPGFMMEQMAKQQAVMEAKGMSPEQIEMGMKFAKMFMSPGILATFALFGGIIFYTIINLIIVAIMKKDPPVNFENQNPINTSAY